MWAAGSHFQNVPRQWWLERWLELVLGQQTHWGTSPLPTSWDVKSHHAASVSSTVLNHHWWFNVICCYFMLILHTCLSPCDVFYFWGFFFVLYCIGNKCFVKKSKWSGWPSAWSQISGISHYLKNSKLFPAFASAGQGSVTPTAPEFYSKRSSTDYSIQFVKASRLGIKTTIVTVWTTGNSRVSDAG